MKPAIFLDRDGTINEEMGYINHPDRFIIFPFIAESIKRLKENGYLVFIITNQAGIARGYFDESVLRRVHDKLHEYLKTNNAEIHGLYYCPHHPTEGRAPYKKDCDCRKPKPGMIKKAMQEFDIDIKNSITIGDRYKDIEFGKQQSMKTGLVLTGYGKGEYTYQRSGWKYKPDFIGKNLYEVVEEIVKFNNGKQQKSFVD